MWLGTGQWEASIPSRSCLFGLWSLGIQDRGGKVHPMRPTSSFQTSTFRPRLARTNLVCDAQMVHARPCLWSSMARIACAHLADPCTSPPKYHMPRNDSRLRPTRALIDLSLSLSLLPSCFSSQVALASLFRASHQLQIPRKWRCP